MATFDDFGKMKSHRPPLYEVRHQRRDGLSTVFMAVNHHPQGRMSRDGGAAPAGLSPNFWGLKAPKYA
jgi:hypothetical protein